MNVTPIILIYSVNTQILTRKSLDIINLSFFENIDGLSLFELLQNASHTAWKIRLKSSIDDCQIYDKQF